MTDSQSELQPEIAALLDVERARPGMPADAQERVLGKLGVSLGVATGALVTHGAATAAEQASSAAATAGGATTAAKSGLTLGAVLGSKAAVGVVCFALGGVTALEVDSRLNAPQSVPTQQVSRPAPTAPIVSTVRSAVSPVPQEAASAEALTVAQTPTAPTAMAAPSQRLVRSDPAVVVEPAASAVTRRDVGLAAERALVERARSALARGDHAGALASLAQHRSRFPKGRLREEREALAIVALSASGRGEEASKRAEAFRKDTPNSILLPSVDAAVKSGSDENER